MTKKINWLVIVTGLVVGVAAILLTAFGNPANMGFCIACFLRDIAGATHLHGAAVVQYVRPEIVGLVLGATIMALATGEFKARAGSSPATRFVLGAFVMIGALVFLGCPLRMVIRMGGGDLNAFVGLAGFFIGILIGIFFLKKGFTLKRSYVVAKSEGAVLPTVLVVLLVLAAAVPALFAFSETGPGSKHAPVLLSLFVALIVGALAQKSRLCMVGGMRDAVMFRDFNLLGMVLVGWGSVLLGGCPLRQLILAGEGNGDSAVTVFGMIVGAAFAHNFKLAGSAASLSEDGVYAAGGIATTGKVAVAIGFAVLLVISIWNTVKKKEAK